MANEVFAPTTATFGPGVDVVGIGTTLPTELAAWVPFPSAPTLRLKSALVFYNSGYSAVGTSAAVKFAFIGTAINPGAQATTVIGYGIVANPSVSGTAVILAGFQMNMVVNPFGGGATSFALSYSMVNHNNQVIFQIAEDDVQGDGAAYLMNNAGVATVRLYSNLLVTGGTVNSGAIQTVNAAGTTLTSQTPA